MISLRRRWRKNWPEIRDAFQGGLPGFVFSREPKPLAGAIPVFWYHTVTSSGLEAHLRFLVENQYHTLHADELLAHLRGEQLAPSGSVLLSFDDGPANLFEVVFPLLRQYRCRAVAFVAPHFHQTCFPLADFNRPCSWPEIEEMHLSGLVDFQSHTLEHRYVPRWPEPVPLTGIGAQFHRYRATPHSLEEDLRTAKAILEAVLAKPVKHLAFPRFAGTKDAVRVGQHCGYQGFWWGLLPPRPLNRIGDDGTAIVRLSGDFLRRLPGRGRSSLAQVYSERFRRAGQHHD